MVETLRNFYKKDFDAADVRQSIVAAVSVRVIEPVFESQTKTKLGSADMAPGGPPITAVRRHVCPATARRLPPRNRETADALKRKLEDNERERKELAGIRSLARERAKKASLHNRKLRDCRLHLGDRNERAEESTLFIVEGDSAAGSLTACRDVQTQAVFALKGKPLNTYGLSKKVIYENEEFHLLQSALNIEEGLDGLRYDAHRDRHRRRRGRHAHPPAADLVFPPVLPGPDRARPPLHPRDAAVPRAQQEGDRVLLLRGGEAGGGGAVRRRRRDHALQGPRRDFAREFKDFIGEGIRLEPVTLAHLHNSDELLSFFMGKNTPERQDFIIGNLKVEKDLVEA